MLIGRSTSFAEVLRSVYNPLRSNIKCLTIMRFKTYIFVLFCGLISTNLNAKENEDLFLRESTLFTNKGKFSSEYGIFYKKTVFSTLDSVVNNESLTNNFILRYGITQNLESTLSAPFIFSVNEHRKLNQSIANEHNTGFGDLKFNLKYHAFQENQYQPDILFSIGIKWNNGEYLNNEKPSLGSGSREYKISTILVKIFDPAVIFTRFSYIYPERNSFKSNTIDTGHTFNYSFGSGYSLSDQITFGMAIEGNYLFNPKINNDSVGRQHAITLQLSNTIMITKSWFIEPSVAFGLTPEAPDVVIGVVIPIYY